MSTVHVLPVNDLIEHVEVDDECPCGPDVEAVFRDDGSNGWLITHHSLDGRERHEDGRCIKCQRGDHHLCTGYDGPITTHPDSLPLCPCDHPPPHLTQEEKTDDR